MKVFYILFFSLLASLSGFAQTELIVNFKTFDGTPIPGVEVNGAISDENGQAIYYPPANLSEITFKPKKSDFNSNCITNEDAEVLADILLGIDGFKSPYHIISADLDDDEISSALDVMLIQDMTEGDFVPDEPWLFVVADYNFPNPTNPFANAFPEEIFVTLNPSNPITLTFDYIGILRGNVDDDYTCLTTTSTNDLTGDQGIRIFPNPTTDVIQIELGNRQLAPISLVQIYDAQGRLVVEDEIENFEQIDVSQLVSGMYVLRAYNGDEKMQSKFMKL